MRRRRWHRRPWTTRDWQRLARRVGLWFAWLALSVAIQVGTLTLIWELTFALLAPGDASRTGFFQGMLAPRRPLIPPPEIPLKHVPKLEPPEEPPPIEVSPLEAPDAAPDVREKLVGYSIVTDMEPDEAAASTSLLIGYRTFPVPGARTRRHGHAGLKARGGSGLTEHAVALGLRWLARHQDAEGRWDSDGFMKHDPADDMCDGPGEARCDVGVTGLALLAFLGAGYTDRGSKDRSEYAKRVRAGLHYLMESQGKGGQFGSASQTFVNAIMYSHAISTLAMCEVYWMTRNPRYRRSAQDGLDFIAVTRNPNMAWRYEPRGGENDTSNTAWCILALRAGQRAGLDVDTDAFEGAREWIDKMTDPNFGQVGYNYPGGAPFRVRGLEDRFPPEKSHSMTAAGVLVRVLLGEDPRKSEMIKKGANLCRELSPEWNPDDGSIDMYYWYFGTLALFQTGGAYWREWNESMKGAIVKNQHHQGSGARTGSWDPIGVWGDFGGRVYSTAMMTMCLEVYYRYDRVWTVHRPR